MYGCVWVWACAHAGAGTRGSQKMSLVPLELELQVVGGYLEWALGTELRSSALNHWGFSPFHLFLGGLLSRCFYSWVVGVLYLFTVGTSHLSCITLKVLSTFLRLPLPHFTCLSSDRLGLSVFISLLYFHLTICIFVSNPKQDLYKDQSKGAPWPGIFFYSFWCCKSFK